MVILKNNQKQSKYSQNSENDHWCTNPHMSTKTVPTVYQQCTKNSQKTIKTAKMTIGVTIVTCLHRARRIHKVRNNDSTRFTTNNAITVCCYTLTSNWIAVSISCRVQCRHNAVIWVQQLHLVFCTLLQPINPLMGTLKPQSNGPYTCTAIRWLVHWALTGRLRPHSVPSSLYQM